MSNLRLLLLLGVVLAAGVTANVAGAGNGATTTSYTSGYPMGPFGDASCEGVRIVKTGTNAFVKDSQVCTITNAADPIPNGHYVFGPDFVLGPNWYSDYEYFWSPGNGCLRPSVSATLDVSANGSKWSITAYYDPSFTCL
jgi:hypothetical protein